LWVCIADARCGDGKHYVVRADEKLTAFIELGSAISGLHRIRLTPVAGEILESPGYQENPYINIRQPID